MRRFLQCGVFGVTMLAALLHGVAQERKQAAVQDTFSLQDSVSVNVVKADDALVKAGESFTFTVTIDKPPNFEGGGLHYEIAGPGGTPGINTGFPLHPDQRIYQETYRVPAAAPGGTWTVTIDGVSDGLQIRPLPKPTSITFQVIANRDLVFPTSVSITVNPSQQQLLRKAARNLQLRIQDLKAAVASYQEANQQGKIPQVLRTNVDDALKALQVTETEFKSRATAQGQSDLAGVFFGDLRLNYDEVLQNLGHSLGGELQPAGFMNAAFPGKTPQKSYAVLVQATLRPLEGMYWHTTLWPKAVL